MMTKTRLRFVIKIRVIKTRSRFMIKIIKIIR